MNSRNGAPPGAVIWPENKVERGKPTHAERIAHLESIKAKLEATYHSGDWASDLDVYRQVVGALDGRIADLRIELACGLKK